ncbi:tetratricopeptide repeat protein [Marinobacter sp. F4216]|uniref:tetratricopeptide repeat protein n=1 Tax=Marinobacter sp. F4216 TaxID=2874281 RepID=UPI001CBD2E95|nr:tetratricopeptide repeat protein [Marinobacter sp. F4216]
MSQQEIRYLSHLDQARFYQRQGELKASTQEARSAIEMQPGQTEPYFLIIDNLLTAGDAVSAERQVQQLLQRISKKAVGPTVNNRATLILAEAYLKQAKFKEALAALKSISSADHPTELKVELLQAEAHLTAGDLETAKETYHKALTMDPGSIKALIGLSKAAMASGDPKTARSFVSHANEIDMDNGELWLWKAQLAHLDEHWESAEEAYVRALDEIGQYDIMTAKKYATMTALIHVLRAQSKFSEAYVYEEILAKSPLGRVKSNLLAASEAVESGNLTEAERYLSDILAQAPDHQQSNLMLALIRFKQGRSRDAQELLAPIVQKGGSPLANKMLAASLLQMGDAQGAQSTLAQIDTNESDPEMLAMVAIAALENGDWENGEPLMEDALALNPDNHDLRLRYATYLSQRGDYAKALSQVNVARSRSPDSHETRNLEIQIHLRAGDTASAVSTADAWVNEEPKNMHALLARGNLAIVQNQPHKAEEYFTKAQSQSPKSVGPLIALGRLALMQGEREEAKREFQKAVKVSPNSAPAIQGLIASQSMKDSKVFMQSIVAKHPDALGPKLLLLEIALLEEDSTRADDLTATLLEREDEVTPSPNAPLVEDVYSRVIATLSDNGQQDQSDSLLQRAQILFPGRESIAILAAKAAFTRNDEEAARAILQKARADYPNSAAPLIAEATYLEKKAHYQRAAELYKEALNLKSSVALVSGYVRNLQLSGDDEEALLYLEEEIRSHPSSKQLRLNLALLQQSAGEDTAARDNYERLLESEPNNTVILNNLAWIYQKQGDTRALELARRAYNLNPKSGAVADTYGWILLQTGNHQKSISILEKAYELEPDSEEITKHLAEAYRKAGMTSAAERLLEKRGDRG